MLAITNSPLRKPTTKWNSLFDSIDLVDAFSGHSCLISSKTWPRNREALFSWFTLVLPGNYVYLLLTAIRLCPVAVFTKTIHSIRKQHISRKQHNTPHEFSEYMNITKHYKTENTEEITEIQIKQVEYTARK
jgi:hypothetical protein